MSDEPADPDAPADGQFERERERARELLAHEDVTALHAAVLRGDEVDSRTARTGEGHDEGLQALALLAAHLRAVANEAGVDYETVAADAASLAGQVEELAPLEEEPDDSE